MCGIIRTYELQGLSAQSDYSYGNLPNSPPLNPRTLTPLAAETVSLVIWSASELLITIICANIPMLRPLWSKLLGGSSTYRSDGNPGTPTPNGHPTIGSARNHHPGRGRSKDMNAWSELDDVEMDSAMASRLGGPKQGKTSTVVKGSWLAEDNDDARSSDSILRGAGGRGRGIEVQKDYVVSGGSVSTGGGNNW